VFLLCCHCERFIQSSLFFDCLELINRVCFNGAYDRSNLEFANIEFRDY